MNMNRNTLAKIWLTDSYEEDLNDIRKKNRNIVLGEHNINSLRNKFDLLVDHQCELFQKQISVSCFKLASFKFLDTFSPFRLDRDQHDGGITAFIREDIPANYLLILNRLRAYILS